MDPQAYIVDEHGDVLYVRLRDAAIYASRPIEGDDFVILNMDRSGEIIGLQLIDVGEMTLARWLEHFATGEIPGGLFDTVARWLAHRGAPPSIAPSSPSNSSIRARQVG